MAGPALPISVIVPVYNDELYLGRCLESLREQARSAAEVIVVDNGSTDGSVRVADASGLPNLQIIRLRENVGATAARNVALDASDQPFAVFLDSDDFLSVNALESAHAELRDDRCDIALFRVAKTAPDGERVLFEIDSPPSPVTGAQALAMTMPTWRLQTLGVYRRTAVDRARAKFSYHGFSDDEFFARLLLAEARCVTGSAGTYFYRVNPKPHNFFKSLGQTRTNIRSAKLAEEHLGVDYGSGGAVRSLISRNLAGLVARAARGEGSLREVAQLYAEARSLKSKRPARDLHWRLADVLGSAVASMGASRRTDEAQRPIISAATERTG